MGTFTRYKLSIARYTMAGSFPFETSEREDFMKRSVLAEVES